MRLAAAKVLRDARDDNIVRSKVDLYYSDEVMKSTRSSDIVLR